MNKILLATIKHFKSIVANEPEFKQSKSGIVYTKPTRDGFKYLSDALKRGVFISPNVLYSFNNEDIANIYSIATNLYGSSNKEINSTFYNSFSTVQSLTDLEIAFDQMLDYNDTYGYGELKDLCDRLGIEYTDRNDGIENLDNIISEAKTLVYIKTITAEELAEMVNSMLSSGIAMNQDVVDGLVSLIKHYSLDIDIDNIKNKEAMCYIHYQLDTVPSDPVEFLRYIIFLATDKTLLIKNQETIDSIKMNMNDEMRISYKPEKVVKLLRDYDEIKLAQIFNRFKPLFLAFKSNSSLKPVINRISKLSKTHHKPHNTPVLSRITDTNTTLEEVKRVLPNSNFFQLVKAYNALSEKNIRNYSGFKDGVNNVKSFKVRNGKTFVNYEYSDKNFDFQDVFEKTNEVLKEINKRVDEGFGNKKFLLDKGINYTIPTSAKDMVGGYIPNFSSIQLKDNHDFVVGIHWNKEADIDLHGTSIDGERFGWNSSYRNENVIYSGDMTCLNSHGLASEAFQVPYKAPDIILSSILYYSPIADTIPFKLFISQNSYSIKDRDFITDMSNMDFILPMQAQYNNSESLGFYSSKNNKFIITNYKIPTNYGNVTDHEFALSVVRSLDIIESSKLKLSDLLYNHQVIYDESDIKEDDEIIDLRTTSIDSSTFISLFNI